MGARASPPDQREELAEYFTSFASALDDPHVFTLRDGRVTAMRGLVDTAAIRAAFDAA